MNDLDVLAELLKTIRLVSVFHSRWIVRGPWIVQGDADHCAVLHYTLGNSCYVKISGQPPILLRPGDLAIFPYGTPHTLGDGSAGPARPLRSVLPERRLGESAIVRIGDKGALTELMCASLNYDPGGEPPLYRSLPPVFVLGKPELANEPLLLRTLESLVPETERREPGSPLVTLRAFEMVFVLALRVALRKLTVDSPALRALSHPGVSRALSAIYGEFQQPWTLDLLAQRAGMSRSSFAKTFRELVGEGPALHLTRRRVREAVELLKYTKTPLSSIPEMVGYKSSVGFHLAFRKILNDTPGRYRANHGLTGCQPCTDES
ncbi:RCS-specific HTH-type transcriptional activator RclR [Micromonospora sp. MH33]|uniref:AraC family transcriptional regulator n=1 Tax=Micromonospora sp. MH33 TaxID=1945509 RepID=UPI000D148DBE|nr:AraC family transcriptional regulator [Micromonospora sp. MH33]PSK66850.1 RCS-specific HTH-type transcriptional activator RclR [Micromonospora sp. MH33]